MLGGFKFTIARMLCHKLRKRENRGRRGLIVWISGASHPPTLPVDIFLHPVDQAVGAAAFLLSNLLQEKIKEVGSNIP